MIAGPAAAGGFDVAPETVQWPGIGSVTFRPLRSGDDGLERRFIEAIPDESLYQRTLGSLGRASDEQIRQLVDYELGPSLALAAICVDASAAAGGQTVVGEAGDGTPTEDVIGVARYAPSDRPREAEFAVIVADRYRGRGIAFELMKRLHRIAPLAGYRTICGQTFATNGAMLKLAHRLGYTVDSDPEDQALRRLQRAVRRPARKAPAGKPVNAAASKPAARRP